MWESLLTRCLACPLGSLGLSRFQKPATRMPLERAGESREVLYSMKHEHSSATGRSGEECPGHERQVPTAIPHSVVCSLSSKS